VAKIVWLKWDEYVQASLADANSWKTGGKKILRYQSIMALKVTIEWLERGTRRAAKCEACKNCSGLEAEEIW
jgi:hypothetical protein